MKRLLMAVYHFPPSGSVAAHRPHKFAKHLPGFGWSARVLARVPDRRYARDDTFLPETSTGVSIRRIGCIEPLRWMSHLGRLAEEVRDWFAVPDEHWGWAARLLQSLPEEIRRWQPDVLYASSVPNFSLVVAAWVSRRTGIPLVVDFHNEWTGNMYFAPPTRLHDRLHRRLERFVIETAAGVLTLNPRHTEDLRRRYPEKILGTAENGYEPSDYEQIPAAGRRSRPVLMYTGAAYGFQDPTPLLRAIEQQKSDVEVRILGDPFSQVGNTGWTFPLSVERNVPHRHLAARMAGADAFLLFLKPEAARQLPAKLYEYMAAGRPTLAVVPDDGIAAERVRETGCGVVVDSRRPELWNAGIREFLEGLSDGRHQKQFKPGMILQYRRREQTARLAQVLDQIVSKG